MAAARKALALEPGNWQHHLRVSVVSWGEQRLRAAERLLEMYPGLAPAHWLAATVFVARGRFEPALQSLHEGCACREAHGQNARFAGVGLHLLKRLVLGAMGDEDAARAALAQEVALETHGYIYARECSANAWYAMGALHLRRHAHGEAADAFHEALKRVPAHPFATVGLGAIDPTCSDKPRVPANPVDAAIAAAAQLALRHPHAEAAQTCLDALGADPPGSAGWLVPVEPLLHVSARPEVWRRTLATLRHRAA